MSSFYINLTKWLVFVPCLILGRRWPSTYYWVPLFYLLAKVLSIILTLKMFLQEDNVFKPEFYFSVLKFIVSMMYCAVFLCIDFVMLAFLTLFATIFTV